MSSLVPTEVDKYIQAVTEEAAEAKADTAEFHSEGEICVDSGKERVGRGKEGKRAEEYRGTEGGKMGKKVRRSEVAEFAGRRAR